jgi:4-nitrophenyl phosphatase
MSRTSYVFDLDGTLWVGESRIPGALHMVEDARGMGDVFFVTNASYRHTRDVYAKLFQMGFAPERGSVLTSAMAAAIYCASLGLSVRTVGSDALREHLVEWGVPEGDDALVIGYDPSIDLRCLDDVPDLPIIACNMDRPTIHNGCGDVVYALRRGEPAFVIGKPSSYMLHLLPLADDVMVIGDAECDRGMAKAYGAAFVRA